MYTAVQRCERGKAAAAGVTAPHEEKPEASDARVSATHETGKRRDGEETERAEDVPACRFASSAFRMAFSRALSWSSTFAAEHV